MKLSLRYIQTEVWVDVVIFPWITRKELGRIVPMFRNRYFAEILQYCLHERGKRTLDTVDLTKEASIPRTPIPENITSFKGIIIYDFDAQTLDFLHRISTLFTTNDVNLTFAGRQYDLTKLRTAFDNLAPLLHGIHSMDFNTDAIPLVQQYVGPKLPQLKMLAIDFRFGPIDPVSIETYIDFCLDWLTSGERDRTEPKFLDININRPKILPQISQAVQKQFLSAKKPSTFVIGLHCMHENNPDDQIADFHLENNIGEQLDGQLNGGFLPIFRHQVGTEQANLVEWVNEILQNHFNSEINNYLDPIDGNAGANEVNKAGNDEANQPSTSG